MKRLLMILTGSLLILAACTDAYVIEKPPCLLDEVDPLPTGISYSADVQPIFDAKCVLCHNGGQVPDLRPDWSYDELIDGGYVDTDFPCESELYGKLTGSHADRIEEDELITILVWMDEDAKDN